ncbi:uncharacterized protein AC631_04205 [Debaryomyces fabryi]|uniref:protein disulfide-isomerase n=1 Tax=Debaryomyces fabryi TaxID=58627 RepID=A0A0V1PV39_9ASCO|nr:uncharacterized protein AC631_04205 [Debaryomyces fabryi]KSA00051.1 hypothetical protein AC631_04205 [Debaryomyces fabryi]CUM57602.1 unnamed protein product [Debaryomyces fabryi]
MKFWKFSTQALSSLLAAVSVVNASGPSDGEAAADPNSAVVQLTSSDYKSFIDANPLVLTEFFAPWCGYCKILGPEFSKAADSLNESHPNIKLAQVDCTVEEELCMEHGIRGYPSLKVMRGSEAAPEDYDGPREAAGIAEYMIKQSLPAVSTPVEAEELTSLIDAQDKPYIIQVLPEGYNGEKDKANSNETFAKVANENRKDLTFISVESKDLVDSLKTKLPKASLNKVKSPKYLIVRPDSPEDISEFSASFDKESLTSFIKTEIVPYFGDINRDTYLMYMTSPLPLGYYFYNNEEERKLVEETFKKLGKEHRGKINFVGLDANVFGRHAEALNMNPEVVPLFAIQNLQENKKYGISQEENPEGPSTKTIEKFVKDFFKGKVDPIVKSEPLPTKDEIANQSVVKLVAHNHDDILKDTSKDILVKYYAPWCGHCKKLAPAWEELAEIYGSNKADAKVVIADLDHTANDVNTPVEIAGYPTLVFYPANGKIDSKTGLREAVVYDKPRELDSLIEFIKDQGGHKIDGSQLRESKEAVIEEDEINHDEL